MKSNYLIFHPGTQHSWQTALAMQQLGRLDCYATSIFYQPDKWPYRLENYLPKKAAARLHAEFRRFSHPSLDTQFIHTSGVSEWVERIVARLGYRKLARKVDYFGNRQFARSLRSRVGVERSFGVWSYDNSALDLFRFAKEAGRTCVLDRTNGDWRAFNRIMSEVYKEYPDFFLSPDFLVSQERIEHNQMEFELADAIVVGSPFAADTVRDNVGNAEVANRVRVLNYCYDERLFGNQPLPEPQALNKPLSFLFVGQAGVRKGIHLVLKAIERIPATAASLTIVGDLQVPPSVFARYADRVNYLSTVARADMPGLMADADVLLFPSYFEGSALSLLEGMASGLAVIQSANAGCGVTPQTGILLRDHGESTLYEAMMYAIENRDQVLEWRHNAQIEAKRYSFDRYRSAIDTLITELDR